MQSNVDMYGGIIHTYILQLRIWIIYILVDSISGGRKTSNPL